MNLIDILLDPCSYSELKAPKGHVINDESSMILSDITFLNKKRFMLDTGLVGINYIQQQDKRVGRTEMIVSLTSLKNRLFFFKAIFFRLIQLILKR